MLQLRPLNANDVSELAATIAGASVPQALLNSILEETAGNPLYVTELVRYLLELGKVRVSGGRVVLDVATAELGVPGSLRHLVRQRVARLTPQALSLVQVASLAGPTQLSVLVLRAHRRDRRPSHGFCHTQLQP